MRPLPPFTDMSTNEKAELRVKEKQIAQGRSPAEAIKRERIQR